MNFDWEVLQTALKNANGDTLAVIDSEALTPITDTLIKKYSVQPDRNHIIAAIVTRHFLHIIDDATIKNALTASGVYEPQQTVFIYDLKESLAKFSNTTSAAPALNTPDITSDIAEAEAALARVSPVRTMARDMNDLASQAPHEPTAYQSTQPSSLRPAANGGTPPTSPSWGSQN